MNILACYKIVPEENDMKVNPDHTLSSEGVELKVGQFDLNAIEAGMQLFEAVGGSFSALTAGGEEVDNSKMKKRVLSIGPERNYAVCSQALAGADSTVTAKVLAEAVKKIGEVDLIICGEGSSDYYSQQVGIQLGETLGIPAVNGVKAIHYENGKLTAERDLQTEIEYLEIELPAVLSVTSDCNTPRLAGMKSIMAAGKKPTTVWTADDITIPGSGMELISILAPDEKNRLQNIFKGDDAETVAQFVKEIKPELG